MNSYLERREARRYDQHDGSLNPPRTTACCFVGEHQKCGGRCTPPIEYYLADEIVPGSDGTVACECPCHPVVVVP